VKDKTLFRLALFFSLLGVFLLFLFSRYVNDNLSYDLEEGDLIEVSGKVSDLRKRPAGVSFKLDLGSEKLNVIASEGFELRDGMKIKVNGEVGKDFFVYANKIEFL
jgi:hypothetical protein